MADLHTDPESLPVSCMIRGRLRGLLRERDDARVRAERAEDTLSLVQQQRDQAVTRAEQAEREATQLRAAESRRLAPGALTEPPMRSEERSGCSTCSQRIGTSETLPVGCRMRCWRTATASSETGASDDP